MSALEISWAGEHDVDAVAELLGSISSLSALTWITVTTRTAQIAQSGAAAANSQ